MWYHPHRNRHILESFLYYLRLLIDAPSPYPYPSLKKDREDVVIVA